MKSPIAITMRTVARAAGVATSTVSKALRDDPTIPEARRRQIREVAQAQGYRPNPLVATLMAQLHGRRRRNDPHHLAWIDLWPNEEASARLLLFQPLLKGARERAAELGYGIEVHRPVHDRLEATRLRQIILARSQWGVVIPPVPEGAMHYPLDVQGLAAVTIGTSLRSPLMHRIAPNFHHGGQLACERLRAQGFRRIGLVLGELLSERVERQWLGAYLVEQRQWPVVERLPPLIVPPEGKSAVQAWARKHRPDAVLIAEPQVEAWLVALRPAPATVWLLCEGPARRRCGIDYRGEKIGAAAVEMVVGQIHRNERGSPGIPNTLLMEGIWVEPRVRRAGPG